MRKRLSKFVQISKIVEDRCSQVTVQKIFITGNAGTGKTTLSHRLAKLLNRQDVISLDPIVWKSGWILADKEEKEAAFAKIVKKRSWIVDGVSKTILEAADTIIFLDYPRYICYWRVLQRNRKYLFKSRPGLPEKCPEILIIHRLTQIIWNFHKVVKPMILEHTNENKHVKNIFHVTNNKQLEIVIDQIKGAINGIYS